MLNKMTLDYEVHQSKIISTRINDDGKQVRVVRLKKKKKKLIGIEDTRIDIEVQNLVR
jgi:predicted metalloprotease